MITRLLLTVCLRAQTLTRADQTDRGDGPVPTAIIVAGLAILATAVVAWASGKAHAAMDSAP